ncbi:MAG: hypothetical protein ACYCTB_03265 [bacterium]
MNKKTFLVKIKQIKLNKAINIFAYLLIFLFLSFIFVYIFFPYNDLKKPIERLLVNKTGLKIKINSIHRSFPFNITLSNIKIYNATHYNYKPNINIIAAVKSIKIGQLIAVIFNYIIYKKILVNITLNNLRVNSIKTGFLKIPQLNFRRINTKLNIENNQKISGIVYFTGDLNGKLKIKNSIIKPILRINNGYFIVKPNDVIYNKFSTLFNTMFKKNKKGYFVYSIRSLIL